MEMVKVGDIVNTWKDLTKWGQEVFQNNFYDACSRFGNYKFDVRNTNRVHEVCKNMEWEDIHCSSEVVGVSDKAIKLAYTVVFSGSKKEVPMYVWLPKKALKSYWAKA